MTRLNQSQLEVLVRASGYRQVDQDGRGYLVWLNDETEDRVCFTVPSKIPTVSRGMVARWEPDVNLNQMEILINGMRAKGHDFQFEIGCQPGDEWTVSTLADGGEVYGEHETLGLAMCFACLKAMNEGKAPVVRGRLT